jgi:hypothetical protein
VKRRSFFRTLTGALGFFAAKPTLRSPLPNVPVSDPLTDIAISYQSTKPIAEAVFPRSQIIGRCVGVFGGPLAGHGVVVSLSSYDGEPKMLTFVASEPIVPGQLVEIDDSAEDNYHVRPVKMS